ncbi:MAG: RelA/SpoT family protein [Candidatus Bruticola sp.]
MTYIPEGCNPQAKFDKQGPNYPEFEDSVRKSSAHLSPECRDFIVNKVYPYANYWHQFQKPRINGKPYISHPVAVVGILAPYKLDVSSVAAALLHDVHEDNENDVSLDDIKELFGTDIRNIVDGLTKIGKASARQRREAVRAAVCEASAGLLSSLQASFGLNLGIENNLAVPLTPAQIRERARQAKLDDKAASLTKLVTEMARDIRIIIVKLADRLHNMYTLDGLRQDKQIRIAQETLNFFAPLATRLGMWPFKVELEDLCFKYLEPSQYTELKENLAAERSRRSESLAQTLESIRKSLVQEGISAKAELHTKSLYSVFAKMRRQHKTLEQIFDLDPISIVVDDKNTCYQVLRVIHQRFGFLQGKFRDYIANPKSNNYQALHTTISADGRLPVEIQICTYDEEAENNLGVLNVFVSGRYSAEANSGEVNKLFRPFAPWLASLSHIKEGCKEDQDFLDVLCQDELTVGVVCTTPDGRSIELPQGATPLDFAFKIHTQLGLCCTGAIINDREVSLTGYELRDNDVVQILSSDKENPSRNWYAHCRTRQARSVISKWFFVNQTPEPNRTIGYKMICAELIRQGAAGAQTNAEIMKAMVSSLNFKSLEELYIAIGSFRTPMSNFSKCFKNYRENNPQQFDNLDCDPMRLRDISLSVRIAEQPKARCFACRQCTPVFGDSIKAVGGKKNKGYVIHRGSCSLIAEAAGAGRRIYEAEWISGIDPKLFMLRATIQICALVRHGLSNSVISVFDSKNVLIYNYKFTNDYAKNVTSIKIEVGAASIEELEMLMDELRSVDSVVTVERA